RRAESTHRVEAIPEHLGACHICGVEVDEPEAPPRGVVDQLASLDEWTDVLRCDRVGHYVVVLIRLDDPMTPVAGHVAEHRWTETDAQNVPALLDEYPRPLNQVAVDQAGGNFCWVPFGSGVAEQSRRGLLLSVEADDGAVHGRGAGGLAGPREGAMREPDAPPCIEDRSEERWDGLALGDGVGGDEREPSGGVYEEVECLSVPAGDVVQA